MRLRTIVALLVDRRARSPSAIAADAPGRPATRRRCSRLGWVQDVQTLNPFVAQDEENFRIWALNWDLLVNFSPDDLSPVPGIAKSWDVSKDKKTVTFKLIEGAKWSDGEPITSKDVKYSLDDARHGRPDLHGLHAQRHHDRDARTTNTVVVHTKQPDARIVGGLFVYIIPEHVYGKDAAQEAHRTTSRQLPLVGSGPYDRHRVRARPHRDDGAQPELPRREARLRRDPVHQVRDDRRRRAGAAARRDRRDPRRPRPPASRQLGEGRQHQDRSGRPRPSFTQLTFNLCSKAELP